MSERTNIIQRRELNELQKSSEYRNQVATLELSNRYAQDQVHETNSMLEQLRAETVSLRAERSLLKPRVIFPRYKDLTPMGGGTGR